MKSMIGSEEKKKGFIGRTKMTIWMGLPSPQTSVDNQNGGRSKTHLENVSPENARSEVAAHGGAPIYT